MNTVPKTFDITQFNDIEVGTYVINDPITGQPTDASFDLAGPISPKRQAILLARTRRLRGIVGKTGKLPETDPQEDYAEETDFLAACTSGWANLIKGDAPLEFSTAAAAALYADPLRQWLRHQISAALETPGLFISDAKAA